MDKFNISHDLSSFFSPEDRLERCLRRHREECRIARRANAILLLGKGKSCAEIAEFLYFADDTDPWVVQGLLT